MVYGRQIVCKSLKVGGEFAKPKHIGEGGGEPYKYDLYVPIAQNFAALAPILLLSPKES